MAKTEQNQDLKSKETIAGQKVADPLEQSCEQLVEIGYHGNMEIKETDHDVASLADIFAALGSEARLRIVRLLLSAHPGGMVVGDIQAELGIPGSTLSHHLDKLRSERLVAVRRDRQFLWYSADAGTLGQLLGFLFAECCSRNRAVEPEPIIRCCG